MNDGTTAIIEHIGNSVLGAEEGSVGLANQIPKKFLWC